METEKTAVLLPIYVILMFQIMRCAFFFPASLGGWVRDERLVIKKACYESLHRGPLWAFVNTMMDLQIL
jgi:hypothetical protein